MSIHSEDGFRGERAQQSKESDAIPAENIMQEDDDEQMVDKTTNKDKNENGNDGGQQEDEQEEEEEEEDEKSDGSDEGKEYEVEKIMDVKIMNGELKYEVHWKGYGAEDDSWEPEENLQSAHLILRKFMEQNKKKLDKLKRILSLRKKPRKRSRGKKRQSSIPRSTVDGSKNSWLNAESDTDSNGKSDNEKSKNDDKNRMKTRDSKRVRPSSAVKEVGDGGVAKKPRNVSAAAASEASNKSRSQLTENDINDISDESVASPSKKPATRGSSAIEVIGLAKSSSGNLSVVVCNRMDNNKKEVLTVEEMVGRDAMGFVEYLLSRCVFEKPSVN